MHASARIRDRDMLQAFRRKVMLWHALQLATFLLVAALASWSGGESAPSDARVASVRVAAVAPTTSPTRPEDGSRVRSDRAVILAAVRRAARRARVDPDLAVGIARVESVFDHSRVSAAGAVGVMQLMPGTAKELGVDSRNLKQNIRGGVTYLRRLLDRFDGNVTLAVAAYNAGPTRVARLGRVPDIKETRQYVAKVIGKLG